MGHRCTDGSVKVRNAEKACGPIRRGVEEQDDYFAFVCLKTRLARGFITSAQFARVVKMGGKNATEILPPITHCDGNLIAASIPQQSNP